MGLLPLYIRFTVQTDRGPVSVLHALPRVPEVGDTLELPGGRTVIVRTVNGIGQDQPVQVSALQVGEGHP